MVSKQKKTIVFTTLLITKKAWSIFGYIKTVFEMVNDIKTSLKKTEVKLYHQILSVTDLLNSYIRGLRSHIRLKQKVIYKNQDISYLVSVSLMEDHFRYYWNYAYKQYYFSKRLFKDFKIRRLVYPYENHPWEKLMVTARNQLRASTELIAFQHTSLSFKLLQHFPGKYEKDIPIYPDKILTVGNILKDVMIKYGHYRDGLVEAGCALRHPYLFKLVQQEKKQGFTKKIAYAFSSDPKGYSHIINNLISVFGNSEYTIYLKIHPEVSQKAIIDKKLPDNFILAKHIDWKDIYEQIDLLFYDDNSVGVEALKYDVDVVYFGMAEQVYNSDRLFKFNGNKYIVTSLEELREFIFEYYQGKLRKLGNRRYNHDYLYQYFLPITNERLEKFL